MEQTSGAGNSTMSLKNIMLYGKRMAKTSTLDKIPGNANWSMVTETNK